MVSISAIGSEVNFGVASYIDFMSSYPSESDLTPVGSGLSKVPGSSPIKSAKDENFERKPTANRMLFSAAPLPNPLSKECPRLFLIIAN